MLSAIVENPWEEELHPNLFLKDVSQLFIAKGCDEMPVYLMGGPLSMHILPLQSFFCMTTTRLYEELDSFVQNCPYPTRHKYHRIHTEIDQFKFSVTEKCRKPRLLIVYFCSMIRRMFPVFKQHEIFGPKKKFHDFSMTSAIPS